METRHLTLQIDDEGVPKTIRTQPILNPEKLRLRNTYGIKILECLKRGARELHSIDSTIKFSIKKLESISNKICDLCYDKFRHSRRTFKQKIFDIYTNLKRSNNHDLRRKILTRSMSITELINSDTLKLAPDQVQKERLQELEKHYLRNVILYTQQNTTDSLGVNTDVEDVETKVEVEEVDTDGSSFNGDLSDEENEGVTEGSDDDDYDDYDDEDDEDDDDDSSSKSKPIKDNDLKSTEDSIYNIHNLNRSSLLEGTKITKPTRRKQEEPKNQINKRDTTTEVTNTSVPPEVQSTSVPLAESSSIYISLKSKATPGDRGGEDKDRTSSGVPAADLREAEGEVNKEAATASGMKSSTGPQVEPAADLREAKGQLNKKATTASGAEVDLTSGGTASSTGPQVELQNKGNTSESFMVAELLRQFKSSNSDIGSSASSSNETTSNKDGAVMNPHLSFLSRLSTISNQKRLRPDDSEEIERVKLPKPPNIDKYKLDLIYYKIERRVNKLPITIAKPFNTALQYGIKRIKTLMQRYVIHMKHCT